MQPPATRVSLVALALGLPLLLVTAGVGAAPDSQSVPDHYIVVLKDEVVDPQQVANEMAQQHGLAVSRVYQYSLKGFAARIPSQSLDAVRADPRVLYVSEDREVQTFGQAPPAAGDSGAAGEPGPSAAGAPVNPHQLPASPDGDTRQ